MMIDRARHMFVKECIQVLRDPRMKAVIFVAPVLQLILFGYAVTTDVRHVRLAVCDLDNSEASRELAARFGRSGHFAVVSYPRTPQEVRQLMDRGAVRAVLQMDKGFAADLRAGRTARLQMIVDGTDSNTAGILVDYGSRITARFSHEVLRQTLRRTRGTLPRLPGLELETRAWFNDNLESRKYFVPGVIASIIMLVTLMLTSMAIVREKEIGTMEQLMVTPISATEFILGKTLPFALIAVVDVLLVTGVGVFWFGVPIRGSLLLLFGATALYLLTTLGIGLFISTVSQTQQQAMMTTFFFFFPALLLSGFLFPIANMPESIQWLTYANPLRYFLIIIRGIFLKGIGADVLWPQLLALAALGVATMTLAVSRFRKTLA
jgi:ABC-2 type transport system permease protein